jgi:hypothetical protein
MLSSLPAEASYYCDEAGRLFPVGKNTPVRILKDLVWEPLLDFLSLEMPVSAMPGETDITVQMKLVRGSVVHEVFALKIDLKDWKNYVEKAPMIRLQQLTFAVSAGKEVLVVGIPLPGLNGQQYWRYKNILLPAGFDFDPPVIADLLPTAGDFTLFDQNGSFETVPAAAFMAVKRTTVRLLNPT